MYLSLYRKWRPRVFDEISGQEHITSILKKQCEGNRVSHAYLFCGTRGTGKTSTAKILAKAINCENPVGGNPCNQCSACRSIDMGSATDVLEIDAASNNRVENVRDLRDEVVYPPSVLKKRVYIIDEVHMLSDSAFNALLKTLEEPPEYVVFILATTEINELPATIISRCIRFDFSRINSDAVKQRLEYVADIENIKLGNGSSDLLAQLADGSMRDALSLLEACTNGHNDSLTPEIIRSVLGLASEEVIYKLLHSIANGNIPDAIELISDIHRSSKDISVFIDDLSITLRDLIIDKQLTKFGKPSKVKDEFRYIIDEFTIEQLFYIISVLEETQSRISRYSMNKRVVLEMAVIKMCDRSISDSPKALAARISELEKKLSVLAATGVSYREPEPSIIEKTKPILKNDSAPMQNAERLPFLQASEIYEFLSNKPSLNAFLKQAKIYCESENIIITGERFVIDMLKTDGKNDISDAFASVTGKLCKIIFEESGSTSIDQQQISLIDEL